MFDCEENGLKKAKIVSVKRDENGVLILDN